MSFDYTPHQVAELLTAGDIQLIDVRARYEHDAGRIAGCRLIELHELGLHAATIDPGRPVILYCRSGARSEMAAAALRHAGYKAFNMIGGMLEWHAAGLPLEPDNGYVA